MSGSDLITVYKNHYVVHHSQIGLDYNTFNLMNFKDLKEHVGKLKSFDYVTCEAFPVDLKKVIDGLEFEEQGIYKLRIYDYYMTIVGPLLEKHIHSKKYKDILIINASLELRDEI